MLATLKQTAELVDFFRLNGAKQVYKKGDFIVKPGEAPPGIFYIYEGLVKAYDITRYEEENLLIIRKQDEIFPLIWAITGEERSIIYRTLAPTTTWRISRKKFLQFISQNPDALAPLLDMTMEMYRLHGERILNLEYGTVRERIISFPPYHEPALRPAHQGRSAHRGPSAAPGYSQLHKRHPRDYQPRDSRSTTQRSD